MTDDRGRVRAKELRRIREKKKIGGTNELATGQKAYPHDDVAAEATQGDVAQAATALADKFGSDDMGALMAIDRPAPVGGACGPEENATLPPAEAGDGGIPE